MKGSVQACTTRVNRSSISASCLYRSLQQREAAIDYVAGAETRNRPLFDHLLQQKPDKLAAKAEIITTRTAPLRLFCLAARSGLRPVAVISHVSGIPETWSPPEFFYQSSDQELRCG
jgi:hypothetical protein